MCRVLNKRSTGVPAGTIYIGRGSNWGNPFRIGPDGNPYDAYLPPAETLPGQSPA